MSQFPSLESDELVTKQFLRAELAERLHQQTMLLAGWLGGAVGVATAVLATLITIS